MLPLRISDATRVLAENQDEYMALAIRDEKIGDANVMTSAWEPTPSELSMLTAGGAVRLSILGKVHPPVLLSVQDPPVASNPRNTARPPAHQAATHDEPARADICEHHRELICALAALAACRNALRDVLRSDIECAAYVDLPARDTAAAIAGLDQDSLDIIAPLWHAIRSAERIVGPGRDEAGWMSDAIALLETRIPSTPGTEPDT